MENGTTTTCPTKVEFAASQLLIQSIVAVVSILLFVGIGIVSTVSAIRFFRRQQSYPVSNPIECNVFLVQETGNSDDQSHIQHIPTTPPLNRPLPPHPVSSNPNAYEEMSLRDRHSEENIYEIID